MKAPLLHYASKAETPVLLTCWVDFALCAAATAGGIGAVMYISHSLAIDGYDIAIVSPFLGLGGMAYLLRHNRAGSIAVLVAIILCIGLEVMEYHDTSKSSTAGLGLVVTFIMQWLLAALAGGVALGLKTARQLNERQKSGPE